MCQIFELEIHREQEKSTASVYGQVNAFGSQGSPCESSGGSMLFVGSSLMMAGELDEISIRALDLCLPILVSCM
jgi:hypothetical protein